jgi:TRAP-type transport system periplasmic protein
MRASLVRSGLAALLFAAPIGANAEPTMLKFSFPGPPTSTNLTGGLAPWAKDVENASDGTLKIQIFTGGTISNIRNTYDRLLNNVIDIGYSTPASYGGVFKGTSVTDMPFLVHDIVPGAVALWNLYADGTLAEEYAKVHPLALYLYPGSGLQTKKPVHRMADLHGLKIGTQGITNARLMEHLGGTPITLTTTENYQSLQRGLVDGVQMGWTGFVQFKLQEVTSYHLDVAFGTAAGFTLMSSASYARLPAKAKAAIDKYSGEAFSRRMGVALSKTAAFQKNYVAKLPGHYMVELAPDEEARWIAAADPVIQEWIKSTPNGAKVLAAFKAELKKAGDK